MPRFNGIPLDKPMDVMTAGGRFGGILIDDFKPALKGAEHAVKDAFSQVSQKSPGVDYTKEVQEWAFRGGFSRMDSDNERASWLESKVGKGEFLKDDYGTWIIKPSGAMKLGIQTDKPIPIDMPEVNRYDVADWAGDAPAVAGGVLGGVATAGAGFLPAMAVAGLGAMGGKGIDEAVQSLQGTSQDSALETYKSLLDEGKMAAGGEGAVRALRPIGRLLMGPHTKRPFTVMGEQPAMESTIDPARIAMTKEAQAMGGAPSIAQATGKPIIGRGGSMFDTIFGVDRDLANNRAIIAGKQQLLRNAGGNPNQAVPHVTDAGLGKMVAGRIDSTLTTTQQAADAAAKQVDKATRQAIYKVSGKFASGDAGQAVVAEIKAAKDAFSAQANDLYSAVDDLAQGPVVGTQSLKDVARNILEGMPQKEGGGATILGGETKKFLTDILAMEDNVTFKQMQNARSAFSEAAYDPNILKDISAKYAGDLKKAATGAMDDAGNSIIYKQSPIVDAAGKNLKTMEIHTGGKEAAQAWRTANDFYSKNIAKFDDVAIARITRQAGRSGSVEPDEIVNLLVKPRKADQLARVLKVVSPNARSKIAKAHFDDLMNSAKDEAGEINGSMVYRKIKDLGNVVDTLYGPQAKEIRTLARELAAKNGKVNLEGLNQSSDIVIALKESVARQTHLDATMKNSFIKKLQSEGLEHEKAVDYIFRPQNSKMIGEAKKFFGENSPEWMKIRQKAMERVLKNMTSATDDPVKEVISGVKLVGELEKYGPETLSAMFGKELAGELAKFAKVTHFLTTRNTMSGGLVAANIALHPLKNVKKLVRFKIASRFLNSPAGIKYFTEGWGTGGKFRATADNTARLSAMLTVLAEDETGSTITQMLPDAPEQSTTNQPEQNRTTQ